MSRRVIVAAAFVLIMVGSPLVAAWGGKGGYEPDTKRDIKDGWMFTTTDTNPSPQVEKVYFNGYDAQCAETCLFVSPNVATARTATFTADINFQALLGVWKDCNKDGFIGLGDQGLTEYRSELLLDQSVCPKQDTPTPIPLDWIPVHNDGTWVREFIPIMWRNVQPGCPLYSGQPDCNPYNLNDNGARVWADYGLPEDTYSPSCPLIPVERGTYHSTGGVLHEYDCREGFTATSTFDTADAAVDPTNAQGLSFKDHPRDEQNSNSKLNAKNPWGDESDGSYAQAWDCSKPQTKGTAIGNAPLLGYGYANVSAPKVPPGVATTGSVAGTLNATGSGFDQCSRNTYNNGNGPQGLVYQKSGSHFHEGGALANAPYYEEYDVASTPTRVQADDNLAPQEDSRPVGTFSSVLGQSTPDPRGDVQLSGNIGVWSANTQWTNPFILQRYALQTGPVYHTFYAYVSTAAKYGLTLPKGTTTSTYGLEACGTSTGYVAATNWQCDRTVWYLNSQGQDIDVRASALGPSTDPADAGKDCSPTSSIGCMRFGARVGDPYNLRDIDCYDQSVQQARVVGVGYGVATGQKCDTNNS